MKTIQRPTIYPKFSQAPETIEAYRNLARAVLARAIRDAAGSNLPSDWSEEARADLQAEARGWLTGEDGILFLEFAGFDPLAARRWVLDGCPRPAGYRRGNK